MADNILQTGGGSASASGAASASSLVGGGSASGAVTAGVTAGGVTGSGGLVATPLGAAFNYTIVVQVPIPFLSICLGAVLDASAEALLSMLSVPAALLSLIDTAADTVQNIIDDAEKLIRAIPEATVTILVKVGPATVASVQLVAKKVPVPITTPTFKLALPNLAASLNQALSGNLPIPSTPPAVIQVPIPVPAISIAPLVSVTGGNLSLSGLASASASVTASPAPISNPVYLPVL